MATCDATSAGMGGKIPSEQNTMAENAEADKIAMFYSTMTNELFTAHIKAMSEELQNRDLFQNVLTPTVSRQSTSELASSGDSNGVLKEPKQELRDEQYIVLHEKNSGLQYNPSDGSYHYDPAPIDGSILNNDIAKKLNELNGYGLKNNEKETPVPSPEEPPQEERVIRRNKIRSRPSAKYWDRRGGDPAVDCQCSLCGSEFKTLRELLDHRVQVHSQKAMLTCGFCGKEFLRRTHIFMHLSQEYNIYQCSGCQFSFTNKYLLDKHKCPNESARSEESQEVHERPKITEITTQEVKVGDSGIKSIHVCDGCGKLYTHWHWLEKHMEKCESKKRAIGECGEHETTDFKCEICHRSYMSLFWFEKHKEKCIGQTFVLNAVPAVNTCREVAIPKPETCPCPHCHRLVSKYWVTRHMKECYIRRLLDLNNNINSNYNNNYNNNNNNNNMPSTSSAPIAMPVLIANARRPTEAPEYEDNMEEVNNSSAASSLSYEGQLNTQCSICGQSFLGVSNLLHHRRCAHGMSAMMTCGICGKQCNSMSTIRRHISQEYSLFRCHKCGRNCIDRSSLLRHSCDRQKIVKYEKDTYVPNTKSRELGCPSCHRMFPNATVLYEHRSMCKTIKNDMVGMDKQQPSTSGTPIFVKQDTFYKEPAEDPPMPGKREVASRLECLECFSVYSNRAELNRHRKDVHGKDPLECTFCPRLFPNFRALHDHHMIELQKFKCGECGKLFGRKYMLEFHEGFCGKK